jgi:anti-anti-sigma factor
MPDRQGARTSARERGASPHCCRASQGVPWSKRDWSGGVGIAERHSLQPDPNIFRVAPLEDRDTLRLVVYGELDLANAVEFAVAIASAERRDPRRLVLDLSRLRFLDATCLRIMLGAAKRARASGRGFVIANTPGAIASLFRLTAIDQTVHMTSEQCTGTPLGSSPTPNPR